ncbi:Na/Pi cotransporter family protein [Jutongia hominis]|uniref:Na/Pi cotransporter family protein n=1 Tax=Jutongia hominis TaxID=2763664 RepID=A0ABR7MUA2_9FIRM|nr:Na/Pi cotransporter family protein [Jutongia hominis]MBC8557381.1 Na/Pi cotransporter family protein [Jutongia hominis]
MNFFNVLTMLGGLALFLYGMHIMGDGLAKMSGGKLEMILEKFTAKPITAVLLGAGVTAVIQSSSATTVMVVGFVNSGIMQLKQAVGIIMGANIGTTITSWILSLTGIEGENFVIQMLKPSSFAPILALIGVCLLLFTKSNKKKDIGSILAGFAILMIGMDTMSGAVKPLAELDGFKNLFLMFENPVLGVVAGAVLTAIIQSSSASVGILQALCLTGSVSYASALPIIMGQNIGTCVTALISGIGATKNAKRAAFVHFYFNLIGTVLFMAVFYLINVVYPFHFLNQAANVTGIAVIHSLFNVVATVSLLPFRNGLVKLATWTIRDDATEEKKDGLALLDERFLEKPSFAIAQAKKAAVEMAQDSVGALNKAIDLFKNYDKEKVKLVSELEDKVDHYEDELGTYLMKLSNADLSQKDSQTVSLLLHCIGDFERISDHACNLMDSAKEFHGKKEDFSDKAKEELNIYEKAIREIVSMTYQVFETESVELATQVEPLEEVIDTLNDEVKKKHVKRLRKGKCTIELGFILSDITTNYERIADHCSNIAVCLIQTKEDGYETHEYLDSLKANEDPEFTERYRYYRKKFKLP